MSDQMTLIRDFVETWKTLDAEKIVEFFTEDGIYHNMPIGPVQGRDNLLAMISGFLGAWTWTEWEILNLVETGNLIVAERVDRIRMGDKAMELPCLGIFEIENGKIKVWRDYFDMLTYQKGAGQA